MSILYIIDQGATISTIDGRLVVRKDKRILDDVPAKDADRLVIFGNVHITTPAMKYFLGSGTDVSFLSIHGNYKGRLQPKLCNDAELRRLQYKKSSHKKTCLRVSKSLVSAKLSNMSVLLRRQKRKTMQTQGALNTIKHGLVDIQNISNLDSLRGYEGSSSASYFRAFSSLLHNDFKFQKRTRHPPKDMTNTLLSLGYTLLYNRIYGVISVAGLDPYQGVYHQASRGHATLVSDFMEEYRALIVDSLVLLLVNTREITTKDFSQKKGCSLISHNGLKKVLSRFEDRIQTVIIHPRLSVKLSYQRCIEEQVRQFTRFIRGREKTYVPFVFQKNCSVGAET